MPVEAGVAQWYERCLAKAEAVGSIPTTRSNSKKGTMDADPQLVAELTGAQIYRREFGWTAEDYALDKSLWPETYICPECGKEMELKVSGIRDAQVMTFTCKCGYVKEREP